MGSMAIKRRLFIIFTFLLSSCLSLTDHQDKPTTNYDHRPDQRHTCSLDCSGVCEQCPCWERYTRKDERKLASEFSYKPRYTLRSRYRGPFHCDNRCRDSNRWKSAKASVVGTSNTNSKTLARDGSYFKGHEDQTLHPATWLSYLPCMFYILAYLVSKCLVKELLGGSDIFVSLEVKVRECNVMDDVLSDLSNIKGRLRDSFDLTSKTFNFRLLDKIRRFPWKIKPGSAFQKFPWATNLISMCDPLHWRGFVVDYFIYPAFQLLASYSQLPLTNLPSNVSVLQLAEAGFKYSGEGSTVHCQGCQNLLEISVFKSDPSDSHYHERGCQYVKYEKPLAPSEVSKDDDGSLSNYESCGSDLDSNEIQTDSAETVVKSALPGFLEPSLQELHEKEDVGKSADLDSGIQEDKMAEPNTAAGMQQPRIKRKAVDSNCERVRNDSVSNSSSSSSGYYSATSSITSSSVPRENTEACTSSSSAGNDDDEGFADLEAYTMEAEPHCSNHDQVPPVLTIQCEKNKGHYAYFPIRQLELKYIPSCVRFPQVLEFLKLAAMLTVRVIVNVTSSKRPETDPGRDSQNRLGTGSCFERQPENLDERSNRELSGKWKPMKKFFSGKKHKPGRIYVETNRHVVFDDVEAENTEVEFFYDHPNRKEVKRVRGVSIEHSGKHGDYKSILVCKTSDLGLVELINQTSKKMMALLRSFSPTIKDGLLRRIFIIGHPHGGEKVLSYGDSVMIKYALRRREENVHGMEKINNQQQVTGFGDWARKVLLYTADTCQGSSGSPILTFKASNANENSSSEAGAKEDHNIHMELWMHNGVDIKHGLGGSIMKELTTEDIVNHGKPTGTRSYAQDNMSRNNGGDGQSSFSEVVSCPVFTVVGHPSYPAYVAYQSRLDSYDNKWEYHHIHSPVHLAEAGLFYAGYADCVRCFQCGLGLRSWKVGDDVYVEHYKNRPNCQFLQLQLRVRGVNDPETQLRPQPREVNPGNGLEADGPSGGEMPKISMVVQQIASTSTNQTSTQSHNLKKPEQGLSSIIMSERQVPVVGFVTDSLAVQPESSNESPMQLNPGATPCSGAANGDQNLTYTALRRENQFLTRQLTCKVCFKNPIKDLFLPCGELYACTDCSKLLTHCPSCKKQILATVTTYFT